jgi:hypothetical protein
MKKKSMPVVHASLSFTGKKLELAEITHLLGVTLTRVRTENDWPDAIKNNADLPDHLKPRRVWEYEVHQKQCNDINSPLEELVDIFHAKIEKIRSITHNGAEPHVEILVHAQDTRMPYIGLTQKSLSFLHDIGAEIGFDIYTY